MSLESLARVIRGAFRTMRMQADAGKEKYGDWTRRLANAMRPEYASLYGKLLDKQDTRGMVEIAIEDRALVAADSILDTTRERLERGDEPRDVFSTDRAASIALTEAVWAAGSAKMLRAKAQGKLLVWRVGGKPCKTCRYLNGQVSTPGKPFVSFDGRRFLHPGAHVNCKCKVVVKDKK